MTDAQKALELFNTFTVLYNNITSNQAPGLNPYEVGLFLTKAQNQLLQEYFNHRIDYTNAGYDRSEKRQIDFSYLIRTKEVEQQQSETGIVKIDSRSKVFVVNDTDIMFVLNECVRDTNTYYTVMPLSYDVYTELMKAPYKYPVKGCAWRLENNYVNSTDSRDVQDEPTPTPPPTPEPDSYHFYEVIGKGLTGTAKYVVRYVKRPKPFILTDLSETSLTIDGENTVMFGEIPMEFQDEVMERAVTLAKIAWQGGTSTIAAMTSQANRKE